MSEASVTAADPSPLRIGAFMTFATLGFAALIGLIAVFDASSRGSAVGIGAGIAVMIFIVGGTIVLPPFRSVPPVASPRPESHGCSSSE